MKIEFTNPEQMATKILLTDGVADVTLRVEISDDLLAHEVWIHSHDVEINETSEPFMRACDAKEWLEERLDEIAAELGGLERVELAPAPKPEPLTERQQEIRDWLLARAERSAALRAAAVETETQELGTASR